MSYIRIGTVAFRPDTGSSGTLVICLLNFVEDAFQRNKT